MTSKEIMAELKSYGNESTKRILLKHGMREPLFGVKVEHLKLIVKKVKMDYALSLELYRTNNADAMYLAGLIADDEKMTKADLQSWVKGALSKNISEYTVPWVAAGSKHGLEMALEWIDAKEEHIASAGWSTLTGLVALKPDSELPLPLLKKLLTRIEKKIHTSMDRERYTMNAFIIAVGTYVKALGKDATATAVKVGTITVDQNGTACKVPNAVDYLQKVADKGLVGKKKKVLKC
jgi:hypothetical protein